MPSSVGMQKIIACLSCKSSSLFNADKKADRRIFSDLLQIYTCTCIWSLKFDSLFIYFLLHFNVFFIFQVLSGQCHDSNFTGQAGLHDAVSIIRQFVHVCVTSC